MAVLRLTIIYACLFVCYACVGLSVANKPEINTPLGRIKGSYMTSRLEKRIYAFRGIRYAEPPVGPLRFQPPVPVKPWTDVFDGSDEGPACIQGPYLNNTSEDCLRLNVYTTMIPKNNTAEKRPVIVFFHPGGWYVFSGQSLVVGPQYLLDEDVVLVVTNYRLSSLGFLSTGDSLMPGNNGLKDQVQALRWIQQNIAAFGGDPNSVTITGYSAGGASVSLHMVSPMSKGLFHRVIAASGSATFQEPLPRHQKHLVRKQAELLKCPTDPPAEMMNCLRSKSAEEYSETVGPFFEWYGNPIYLWLPVVEPEVDGVERFLTDQPTDLIRKGKFRNVPFITGVTKDEFSAGAYIDFMEEIQSGNDTMVRDMNDNWEKWAPIIFLYERNSSRSRAISARLKEFYLGGNPININTTEGLSHIWADAVIGYPVHRLVNLVAAASRKPVYYYKFTYQGRYSTSVWSDTKKPYGVAHHDDLMYIFYVSVFFPKFNNDDPEIPTVERMTRLWAHFAKTGEPIPANDDRFKNVTWERFTPENKKYLEIGSDFVMKTGLHSRRMQFWDDNFPLKPLTT